MPWGAAHPTTGDAIAICNGGNDGHCVEASEVVKHRLRRPGKMPGHGDPDDPEVLDKAEKKKLKEDLKSNEGITEEYQEFEGENSEKVVKND